jgi:hypothetical protein
MSKSSKERACPAVGREIASAECGEGRGSRYACPAHCLFSPFAPANYSQLLELEAAVDKESLARLDQEAPDRAALAREIQRASREKSPHVLHALIVWRLFHSTDASGRTCAQRWEQAGFPGLKNDGRVLMRAKLGLRLALLEVYRVLDSEQVEVVDLLDAEPKPFIVRDRGFASSAARFSCGLTWTYATPHYHRLSGLAILLQEIPSWEPQQVVREIVRHLGGPTEEGPMRRWLSEHFTRFQEALTAVALERRRLMFANLDAKFGKAVYELRRPFAECREVLDQVEDVDEDDLAEGEEQEGFADARVWFASEQDKDLVSPTTAAAQPMLGRVLMGQSHWRLETMGAEKMVILRQRFEQQMVDRVRFTGERLDDLAQTLAEKDPKADRALVPPRLLENPNLIRMFTSRVPAPIMARSKAEMEAEAFAAMDRGFLDNPVPALDGHTPREAARDPALRPRLIRLMKDRIRSCDERNLETGLNHDANWIVRELGLDEILFDPPPAGRTPRTFRSDAAETKADDDPEGEEEDDTVALPMDLALPPAPRLPDCPFTAHELQERLRAAVEEHKLAAVGCTLIDDVDTVMVGLVEDDHFPLLVPLLIEIWHAFVPAGTRGFNLTRADLRVALLRDADALSKAVEQHTEKSFERYLESGPQPELARIVLAQLLEGAKLLPKKQAPSPEKLGVMGSVLRAVIDELDRANRPS